MRLTKLRKKNFVLAVLGSFTVDIIVKLKKELTSVLAYTLNVKPKFLLRPTVNIVVTIIAIHKHWVVI